MHFDGFCLFWYGFNNLISRGPTNFNSLTMHHEMGFWFDLRHMMRCMTYKIEVQLQQKVTLLQGLLCIIGFLFS